MKTKLLLIVCIFISNLSFGQSVEDFKPAGFKSVSYNDPHLLFKNIIPQTGYLYWECSYNAVATGTGKDRKIIFRKGNLKYQSLAAKYYSNTGFINNCSPSFCYYYIIAIKSDRSVEIINTKEALQSFIGTIDNLDEVELSVLSNNYVFDTDTLITGAYRERENDYLLFLTNSPLDLVSDGKKEVTSIKAVLTKAGNFKVIDQRVFDRNR